jgi:hypothetical protein
LEKAVASQVVDAILLIERQLTVLDVLSDNIADDNERREFRRGLASIISAYTDVLVSVVRQHPDLDPDKPETGARKSGG